MIEKFHKERFDLFKDIEGILIIKGQEAYFNFLINNGMITKESLKDVGFSMNYYIGKVRIMYSENPKYISNVIAL